MKYLLDSHILIWALFSEEKLPNVAYQIINNPTNEVYCSAASVWEISIKHNKSPEKMPISGQLLASCCDEAKIFSLPITKEHTLMLSTLHRPENAPPHNDPFDRMLIAQAKAESMILLTHDSLLKGYGETCVETV